MKETTCLFVLTVFQNKIPSEQSDDVPCPNQGSSIYTDTEDQCGSTTTPWNPAGENILWRNWDFPIFLINDGNTTQDLFDCYDEFNRYIGTSLDNDYDFCTYSNGAKSYLFLGLIFSVLS